MTLRRWIEKTIFWYAVGHEAFMVAAALIPELQKWALSQAFRPLAMLFLIVWAIGFVQHPYDPQPYWLPVLRVTKRGVWLARVLLATHLGLFVALMTGFRTGRIASREPAEWSFFFSMNLYIALHWGFRPENVFSPRIVQLVSNPSIPWLVAKRRKYARPTVPFEEWIREFVPVTEVLADSERLRRAWGDKREAIPGAEDLVEVLFNLGSYYSVAYRRQVDQDLDKGERRVFQSYVDRLLALERFVGPEYSPRDLKELLRTAEFQRVQEAARRLLEIPYFRSYANGGRIPGYRDSNGVQEL